MHPQVLKHLLQMVRPSQHLSFMYDTNRLDSELSILADIPQDKEHHPEGSAFAHTLMVVDEAVSISHREQLDSFAHAVLVLSALCHDMGKATHTQISAEGKITAYGHPAAGVARARTFLRRSQVTDSVIEWVLPMVDLHMAWVGFYTPDITSKSVKKLIQKAKPASLNMLALVVEADMSGRGGKYYKQGLPQRMKDILTVANTLYDGIENAYPDHLLSGDDIMDATGIEPSPLLGKIKAALYKAQLEGRFTTRAEGILFLLRHVVIAEG